MPATDEELKRALKAFKKRLKLTQLDNDSTLGHSPLSGSGSKVISIQPPSGFGKDVWEELADKGFLKRDGIGFFRTGGGEVGLAHLPSQPRITVSRLAPAMKRFETFY